MKFVTIAYVVFIALTAGCTSSPLRTAQTVEQKGDALYGSYVIAKEQGATIIRDASIPDAPKRPLAEAMVASKEPADALQDSLIEYSAVKLQIAEGKTPQDRLAIVEQGINGWIAKATPVINRLIEVVGGFLK